MSDRCSRRSQNSPGEMTLGLKVELVHTNTMGFMHGGMIATDLRQRDGARGA